MFHDQFSTDIRILSVMAQIPSHQGPTDRARSTFDPTREVRYWTERLGVSPEDVRMAVRRVRAMMQGTRPGAER